MSVHQPPSFLTAVLHPTSNASATGAGDGGDGRGAGTSTTPVSIYRGDEHEEAPTPSSNDTQRPFITLTFAQSLDAKIAGPKGKQLALSGKESMVMTHWMRTMHDAILVGIGTALNDNPQLNTRHLPPFPEGSTQCYHLPRPIILDTHLRLPPDCKLLINYREGRGRRPWAFSSSNEISPERDARKKALEEAGATVIEIPSDEGKLSIPSLLLALRSRGIRSLMIEGGASVIRAFLTAAGSSASPVVDTIIVTVAPVLVGNEGVGYGQDLLASALPSLEHMRTEVFGKDPVVAMKVKHQ